MTETMQKRKCVILDLDDVINNFLGYLCYIHNHKHNTSVSPSQIITWALDTDDNSDIFGEVNKDATLDKTFKEYENEGLYAILPVFYEAKQAFKIYRDLGYAIVFLTARDEKFRKQTELNLWANDLIPDKMIFAKDKVKMINELAERFEIIMFCDDRAQTVKSVNTNCKVKYPVLINKSHNKDAKLSQNIIRADDLLGTIKYLTKKEV